MPLFSSLPSAERYVQQYREYCQLLARAGLKVPENEAVIIHAPEHPVVCYIAQEQLPQERFGHRLTHLLPPEDACQLIEQVAYEISKVFSFNRRMLPSVELALDGQISNWVQGEGIQMVYIDTSTPLYRKDGEEQLDPELLLKSAPGFLRWTIRFFFLDGVMNRYYDPRQVYLDLVANLYKEQCQELVPIAIDIVNRYLFEDLAPVTQDEVKRYYRQDKLIWTLFLAFRRLDRYLKTRVFGKQYEFILPGKIER